jgi:hypothetical protein
MWMARAKDDGSEAGQASIELVALLPALALVLALAWQAVLVAESWWLAGTAARAAARTQALGGDPLLAARRALPGPFGSHVAVRADADGDGLRVRVGVPSVVTGVRVGSISVRARMERQR